MKPILFGLLLTSTTLLLANEECCPPPPCIDCECYTPPFYTCESDRPFSFDIEFLYWYGRENQLPLALTTNTIGIAPTEDPGDTAGVVVPNKLFYMDTKLCPGFRLGSGWYVCDGWDAYISYTYYHNKNNRTISVDTPTSFPPSVGQKGVLSPWINPFINSAFLPNTMVAFDRVRGSWRLNYNMFDGEFGRRYWLSRCFTLRPFIGLRGGWIKINYNLDQSFSGTINDDSDFVHFDTRFRNTHWGMGLLGGFQPAWYFCPCFGMYGLVDFSLLWGKFNGRRSESFSYQSDPADGPINGSSTSDNCLEGMIGAFDLGIGLRYDTTFCCDCYRINIDLGWEHHIWYGIAHRLQMHGNFDNLSSTNRLFAFKHSLGEETDLSFGGLVVRARLDF